MAEEILGADQSGDAGIAAQRERVARMKEELSRVPSEDARRLEEDADALVRKTVWIVGGDGWAYDIGFGGLDHVLASGRDVNLLVLDTEVYSNTGGQQSKATPLGAAAKFAVSGKESGKKDLGLMAMTYGNVYVARVAFGAKDHQTLKALQEAESYPGPSLVIAYAHCIAHGYDMADGTEQQKLAVESGFWPLYRFDPRRLAAGQAPLQLDSAVPRARIADFMQRENRFRMVEGASDERRQRLEEAAQAEAERRFRLYQRLAEIGPEPSKEAPDAAPKT
jgi:pyruvate-ferredoxin/flavodoxin oxidoreductase